MAARSTAREFERISVLRERLILDPQYGREAACWSRKTSSIRPFSGRRRTLRHDLRDAIRAEFLRIQLHGEGLGTGSSRHSLRPAARPATAAPNPESPGYPH